MAGTEAAEAAASRRPTDTRLPNWTEPGSGLGLSLVNAVARLHKGEFRIEDNAPGVRAVLDLPAS